MDKWFRTRKPGVYAHIVGRYMDTARLTIYAEGCGGVRPVVLFDRVYLRATQAYAALASLEV